MSEKMKNGERMMTPFHVLADGHLGRFRNREIVRHNVAVS
jgi:hypothetical protein